MCNKVSVLGCYVGLCILFDIQSVWLFIARPIVVIVLFLFTVVSVADSLRFAGVVVRWVASVVASRMRSVLCVDEIRAAIVDLVEVLRFVMPYNIKTHI